MKNGKEKTTIMVSTRPGLDSRGWFEEKSNRILEELSFLADILHRPGDAPSGGWPGKREEIDWTEGTGNIWRGVTPASHKPLCSQIVRK